MYLARQVFTAVHMSFDSSRCVSVVVMYMCRNIMAWFVECTHRMTDKSSFVRRTFEWSSPLGLPVVQPYMKEYLLVLRAKLDGRLPWQSG